MIIAVGTGTAACGRPTRGWGLRGRRSLHSSPPRDRLSTDCTAQPSQGGDRHRVASRNVKIVLGRSGGRRRAAAVGSSRASAGVIAVAQVGLGVLAWRWSTAICWRRIQISASPGHVGCGGRASQPSWRGEAGQATRKGHGRRQRPRTRRRRSQTPNHRLPGQSCGARSGHLTWFSASSGHPGVAARRPARGRASRMGGQPAGRVSRMNDEEVPHARITARRGVLGVRPRSPY